MNHSVNHNKKFHQFFGALIRFYQFSMLDCTRLHISSVHRHRKTGHTLRLHTRMSLKPGKRVCWWKGDAYERYGWLFAPRRPTFDLRTLNHAGENSSQLYHHACRGTSAQSEALDCAVELINQLLDRMRSFISYPFEFLEFRSRVKPSIQADIITLVRWGT